MTDRALAVASSTGRTGKQKRGEPDEPVSVVRGRYPWHDPWVPAAEQALVNKSAEQPPGGASKPVEGPLPIAFEVR
jgi:hypothetical protein